MNWIDILVLALCLLPIFVKLRKKLPANVPPKSPPDEPMSMRDVAVDETVRPRVNFEDFGQNSSKNEEYFTYESLEPEVSPDFDEFEFYSQKSVEKPQQMPENEEVKNTLLQLNADEITKGVIYSIILDNPHNQ